jgi:hypothetical protein
MIGAGHEHLLHFRLHAEGGGADTVGIYGHLTVHQYLQAQFFGRTVENIATFFAEAYFPGKEANPYSIAPKRRQGHTQLNALIEKELMGGLDHNTRAVAGIAFATTGTTVFHVLEYSKGVGNVLVRFVAFDVRYETNSTCIAFKRRMIKTLIACHE